MPGYPTLSNHRAQNIVPQPTPSYIQRSQQNSGYPFQTGLAGQQQTQQQQQQQHPPLQHPQPSQQPQQSSNSLNLFPPNSTTPNLGTNHSVSSASEVGLDPNDFPALGSTPATNPTSNQANLTQNNTTSYATQAGGATVTGSGNTQSGTTGLTAEDFPALGGSQTAHQPPQNQSQLHDLPHPPGLNGFNDQNHRPGIISGITPGAQQPGVLNIGQQRLHQFQSEADKRVSLIPYIDSCAVASSPGPRPHAGHSNSCPNNIPKVADLFLAELQPKAEPVESRRVAVTGPFDEPNFPTVVPCVTTEWFRSPTSPEPSATAAATTTSTSAAASTNTTTAHKPTTRSTNSKHVPPANTINTGGFPHERQRGRSASYAVSRTNERVGSGTADTRSTGACLARGSMGATRLDRSDKEHGSGPELAVSWHRPGDDGFGYATKRVKNSV